MINQPPTWKFYFIIYSYACGCDIEMERHTTGCKANSNKQVTNLSANVPEEEKPATLGHGYHGERGVCLCSK